MRMATLNVQNLRLREDAQGPHFDGARDKIVPLSRLSEDERAIDRQDRALTARLLLNANADVVALQEVFDQNTLDAFHETYLAPLGALYRHRVCLPGNDGRRHVALMSRLPLEHVVSHASLRYADLDLPPPSGVSASAPVFRRDCLAASCGGARLFVVHFKAPSDPISLAVVRLEALATRRLIERYCPDPASLWLVLGDVNVSDVPEGDVLLPLTQNFAVDLGAREATGAAWTYFNAAYHSYARPDRILASPAAAKLCRGFEVRREGMSLAAAADARPRLPGVGQVRPRASDHALLAVSSAS
jgi:endonuclease/exonuclease/phosphatase family metal-dependent hydrolase